MPLRVGTRPIGLMAASGRPVDPGTLDALAGVVAIAIERANLLQERKAAELTKRGQAFKEPQRYKGLGEMDADQLADTTMSPRHRTLRRLTVDDAAAAERVFEMLMGNEVAPRKEFIIQGAYAVEADRIDA